jgi:DNA-binding transcriptional MerR regulator
MKKLPPLLNGDITPLYNIGVVTKMTGVSMATLRAWERRYKFPDSGRTEGGHRLYSEKDVLRLIWVKDRIEEGMQTSQAIQALKHLELSREIVEAPGEGNISALPQARLKIADEYQREIMNSLINRDTNHVDLLLTQALGEISIEDITLHIISPILNKVGDLWEEGNIGIDQEHFITNYCRQKLIQWIVSGPPPVAMSPVVLACAPDEYHEGSLLILGVLLRRKRIPVAYLGQSLPLEELIRFSVESQASAVVVVSMTIDSVQSLYEAQVRNSADFDLILGKFYFGGRVYTKYPEWKSKTLGRYLGDDIGEAANLIESILFGA